MFKHILVPTDGSAASQRALPAAIRFAKSMGARVTAYYAVAPGSSGVLGDGYQFPKDESTAEWRRQAREIGARHVGIAEKLARDAGVQFGSVLGVTSAPSKGIVRAAAKHKCDAIFMATQGRRGVSRLLHGSVAGQVVTQARIPVMVYR
jgi:nucleotide-binding universal stress UspA family protein